MPGADVETTCTRCVSAIDDATTSPAPNSACAHSMIRPAGACSSSALARSARARRSVWLFAGVILTMALVFGWVSVSGDIWGFPLKGGGARTHRASVTQLRHRALRAVSGEVSVGSGGPCARVVHRSGRRCGNRSGRGLQGRHTDHAGEPSEVDVTPTDESDSSTRHEKRVARALGSVH